MCIAFLCCLRKLLGCLAPQSSAWPSVFATRLLRWPRNRSSAAGVLRGTRGAHSLSGGGGSTAHPGGSCCEASPGSTWSGWDTRPACSCSADSSWQGAHLGAPAGKSRDHLRPRPRRCSLTSPRRAALAQCVPPPDTSRHLRRDTPLSACSGAVPARSLSPARLRAPAAGSCAHGAL